MASYCQAGDTARISFPDGSIQEFQDTPVSVAVEDLPVYAPNSLCSVAVKIIFKDYYDGYKIKSVVQNYPARTPISAVRIWPNNPNSIIEIFCRGNTFTSYTDPRWVQYSGAFGALPHLSVEIVSVSCPPDSLSRFDKRISVFGGNNNLLFSQVFPSDNYSVECIGNCPPNTLDCGDCCLPCESVGSALVSIRNSIINL